MIPAAMTTERSSTALQRLKVPPTAVASVCRRHGIRRLSLFGSVTRGDMNPGSDVDVMLEFAPGRIPSLFGLMDLQDELSRLFNGRKVDLASPAILRNPYRRRSIEQDLQVAYAA